MLVMACCAGLLHFRGEGRPPASWGSDPLKWWKAWRPNVTLLAEDWMQDNGTGDALNFQHHSFEVGAHVIASPPFFLFHFMPCPFKTLGCWRYAGGTIWLCQPSSPTYGSLIFQWS